MSDAEPIPLPSGLPAHLSGDKEGYDALCALLDVPTRSRRQALANSPAVRQLLRAAGTEPQRQGRTTEKTRQSLLALYGDPDTRRRLWRTFRDLESSATVGRRPLPSLEHAAFAEYDAALLTASPDQDRLAELDGFYVPEFANDEWRAAALAALPRLKGEFDGWASVPPQRKGRVIAAAFAAATLLEDSRLLLWAAAREEDVALEFSFLREAGADSGGQASAKGERTGPRGNPSEDIPGALQTRSLALRDAAQHLADGPATAKLFDALHERYAEVIELREAAVAMAHTDEISGVIDDFAALLEEKAAAAPWLAEDRESVLAAWRAAYLSAERVGSERVREDFNRASAALPDKLDAVAAAQADEHDSRKSLELHEADIAEKEAESRVDRQRRLTLSEDHAKASRAVIDAMDDVLAVLEPQLGDEAPVAEPTPRTASETPVSGALAHRPVDSQELKNEASVAPTEATTSSQADSERPQAKAQATAKPDATPRPVAEETPVRPSAPAREKLPPRKTRPARDDESPTSIEPPTDVAPADDGAPAPTSDQATGNFSGVQAAVWRAIGTGRHGLAYHIARLHQAIGHSAQPSPELLAAVALGTVLRGPDDELATAFGRRVGPLGGLDFGEVELPMRDALNLLLFSATLRPAVFASQHGASIPLLRRVELSGALTAVYGLAKEVADHADKLKTLRLDVPTLTAILDEGVWKDRMAAHGEAVARWREGAGAATLIFAGAGAVWQHWLGRRGILGELTRLLVEGSVANTQRIQEIADLLDDRRAVHALIEDTDRHGIGRHGDPISGRALTQLESRLEVPKDLAREWLRITQARPGGTGFLAATVEQLRRTITRHGPPALQAITDAKQLTPTPALEGALACTAEAIESLTGLFQRGVDAVPEVALGPIQALSDDLLLVPDLPIDEEGGIDDSLAPADAVDLLVDIDSHAETFAAAFDARLSQGDLYGAHAACNRMATEDDPMADPSRERLENALTESRSKLQRRLYDLAERLEQTFVIGEISESERAELTASVDDVSRRLEAREGTLRAGEDVEAIAAVVEPACAKGVARLSAELDAHLPRVDKGEQQLVREAIEGGDLATLHEQLDCLKREQPLLSIDANARSRLRTFLEAAATIEAELAGEAGPTQAALLRAVGERKDILGLPLSTLSPAQAKRSARLVDLWFQIVRQQSPDPELVADFFSALGFTLTPGAVEPRGETAAVLRAEPLRARELCPTHTFGSDADGRYELIFNSSALAREPIVQAIATTDPNAHTIVLHFGKLSSVDRRWLRVWSIEHPTQFITIDEILVLYLASVPEGKLRALFECTLPFTCTEPFFTAPGLVPPEAFFGRERERRDITDRYGSCFVYGGRQLGKTALLHSAEDAFHDPSQHRIAKYLDLKYEDIGNAYDADQIWHVLWREFVKLDVVDHGTPMPRGRSSLVDALARFINDWLNAHKDGRILLLLDEADAFLDKDLERDFRVSTRLKGLMDETERRFKVVLCGLHNVLRNTERANHPLAHFGEPVCVGPLLGNGDLEQARALVRHPMAAVGYEFETENLITKILIWTNYFPSLIQLFGQASLRHLRQTPGRDLPRVIAGDDIQSVFSRDQFRDYIRSRFSLTLQLDQRYEVIAYAMAGDLQGASDRLAEGLSSTRIFDLVREYWPDGFQIPKREFETLLQEMCGLGVLRQRREEAGPGRYVFRNPNVLRLLGDADTILDILYQERDVPETFEASAFRAQYGRTKAGSPRRGPITYEQETTLSRGERVAVLCGSRAANFGEVDKFLEERLETGRLRPLKPSMNAVTLAGEVKRLRPDRDTYICLVDENEPWTLLWLERVADALREAQRGRKLRVVFRADPEQLWRFVAELPDEYLHPENELFDWVGAQPWNAAFLRHWCSDLGLHDAGARIPDLLDLTGGWPLLLERYATSEEKTWEARAAEVELYISQNRDELLDAVGLGATLARRELAPLCAWERLNADEVGTYADLWADEGRAPVSAETLLRRLCWATQLGIVQDIDGSSALNPLVARVIADDVP